jgi:hypothetical protein
MEDFKELKALDKSPRIDSGGLPRTRVFPKDEMYTD